MENIKIFEERLKGKDDNNYKFTIISCDSSIEFPKNILDNVVSEYVGNKLYNEFVEIYNGNPWIRFITDGINEFNYIAQPDDFELFENNLHSTTGEIAGSFAILRGGMNSDKPIEFMSNIVSKYVENRDHIHCIEIFKDNPWVRVILFGINRIPFIEFNTQKL
jgi:hypothetical protein